jgi:hypothetical protein
MELLVSIVRDDKNEIHFGRCGKNDCMHEKLIMILKTFDFFMLSKILLQNRK